MRHGIGLLISAAWIVAGIVLMLKQNNDSSARMLFCFLIIGMGLMSLLITAYSFKQRELTERTNKLLQELIDKQSNNEDQANSKTKE